MGRPGRRRRSRGRRGLLPADRPRLPVRRWRLRGGLGQPRLPCRPPGGLGPAERLRPDRRGLRILGHLLPRGGPAVPGPVQGGDLRRRRHRPGGAQPARLARVGPGLRHSHLPVHGRHRHHGCRRPHPGADRDARTCRVRRARRRDPRRLGAGPDRPGRRLPGPAGLLLGLRGPDRCGGDLQRRPQLPAPQVPQRRHHVAAPGQHRSPHAHERHTPGRRRWRAHGGGPGPSAPAQRRPGRRHLPPGPRDRTDRRHRLLRLPADVLPGRRRHRAHPGPGRQHRLQRIPGPGQCPGP